MPSHCGIEVSIDVRKLNLLRIMDLLNLKKLAYLVQSLNFNDKEANIPSICIAQTHSKLIK